MIAPLLNSPKHGDIQVQHGNWPRLHVLLYASNVREKKLCDAKGRIIFLWRCCIKYYLATAKLLERNGRRAHDPKVPNMSKQITLERTKLVCSKEAWCCPVWRLLASIPQWQSSHQISRQLPQNRNLVRPASSRSWIRYHKKGFSVRSYSLTCFT